MPAQTRAHHQHRQPSLHSMVNFLLFHLSGCLDWTCVASALRHRSCHSHRSDQTPRLSSLRSRLCMRSCGNNLRSLESQREVPGRAAQTHPETMAVDSRPWKLLEKTDDGIARVRFHSIIASRPALITIVYQTSVNVSTMTVTASQTEAGHGRERRSYSGRRAADRRAPLERPAQRSRTRSLPGCSRLHRRLPSPSPHSQPAHLPGHAGAQLDERAVLRERRAALKEELKDLKRRRRDLRAAAPIQAERGGQRRVLYGAPLEKDPSPVVRKGRAGAHSGSRSRSSSVFREAARARPYRFETYCVGRRAPRSPVGSHPPEGVRPAGTRRPAPRLASRGVPPVATNYVHQILRPQFPSMGARNSRELDTLGEIMDRLAVGEFGRAADLVTQRFKAVEMALQELIARELRDEMRLKRHPDDAAGTKIKDRSTPADKGKGVGKDREKAKGGRKSDVSGNLTTNENYHGKRETGKGNENGKGGDKRRR